MKNKDGIDFSIPPEPSEECSSIYCGGGDFGVVMGASIFIILIALFF